MAQDHRGEMLKSDQGETLKFGPPWSSELVIKVDPRKVGSLFAMGLQTISPRGAIPMHRHLTQDEVLFVHKGQGRATLEGRAMTIVPGTMVFIPRQAWHGLRNNGTGVLEITWTVSPPGIEEFFRELGRLSSPPDAATMQEIAKRHGMELHPEGGPQEPVAPPAHRRHHRGRRGGRGRGRRPSGAQAQPVSQAPQASLPGPKTSTPPSMPPPPRAPQPPPGRAPQQPAPSRRATPARGFHRRRVREVYMGGRWVRVEGEGPVIAPGKARSSRGRRETQGEGPRGPITVPL